MASRIATTWPARTAVAEPHLPLHQLSLDRGAQFDHCPIVDEPLASPRQPGDNEGMSSLVPLVESLRGGTLECVHFGALAVADASGKLVASAGDPRWVSFSRSTLKPFQALPFMQGGGPRQLGFSREQVAMMCASHSGEPMHVAQVEGMLDKAGLGYKTLQCGCHVPAFVELGVAPAPVSYDERHNNCSGKHAGFLACCVQRGWPVGNYLAPAHSLQQAIRRDVAGAVGLAPEDLKIGIDGCSAPNYAMPLVNLARAYARLASGLTDSEFGESFAPLADAMTAHPELVSGTGRFDLAFMRAGRGDWVVKGGADGVQAFASKSRAQGFVVKIADGSKIALQAATVAVLDQLGWLDARQREELRPWRAEAIANARGTQVGERRAAFKLQVVR
jgi:L-asparaginase II